MSLEYIYKLNNSEFCMYCPEPCILDSLAESYPDEINDIFYVGEPDEMNLDEPTADIKSEKLVQSIEKLLKGIRQSKDIVPYTYTLEFDDPIIGKYTSITSGYQMIPGDTKHWYRVRVYDGNACFIEKVVKLEDDSLGELVEKKDIGDLKSIEMISQEGPFTLNIKRRRSRFPLIKDLKDLKIFIEENGPGTVTKIFCG